MKKIIFIISCLILGLFGLWQIRLNVFAEQSGSSPESSSTSRIKTIYDTLISYGVGSTGSGTWGNWGAKWNLIYSTANINYQKQSLVEWDDYKTGDETAEESVWTGPVGVGSSAVYKDTRTGLFWSASLGTNSNSFPDTTHVTCGFFNQTDHPTRGSYPGDDSVCGNAINQCAVLSLSSDGGAAKTDWYLPSQKELMQAYVDGIYNQAGSTFTTTSYFWSSTEVSTNPPYAWYVNLYYGGTSGNVKSNATASVRCVRRD